MSATRYIAPSHGHSVLFFGFGTTYKVLSETMGGSLGIVEHTLEPGWLGAPPHRHAREDETSFVLEGELTVEQEGEVVTAGPGGYVMKPRGIFHTFWNAGIERVRFVEIITPGGFEHYFEELAPFLPPNVSAPDMPNIEAVRIKYALEFDMSRVDGLLAKYNLKGGRSPATADGVAT